MPKTEITPLTALRTWKQWEKLNHEIEARIRDIVNSNDEHARDLAWLVRLIRNEPNDSERQVIINKILEYAYINSDHFWDQHAAWMDEHASEQPVRVRKRA